MSKRRLALWSLIVVGLALQLVCGGIGRRMPTPANIYTWLGMSGTIVLLVGCARCAEDKGYSRNYGLLAFLSFIGVAILAILPSRNGGSL
jgi:hypothetical protein